MRRQAICLIFLSFVMSLGVAHAEVRTYRVTRTATPPRIDGILDDACWKDALTIKDFVPLGRKTPGDTFPETQAWITYDAEYLYLAYRCVEPLIPNILMTIKEHDGPVWEDDCIEVFLNPSGDRQRYVQIAINAAGTIMDGYCDEPGRPMDLSYESGAEAATKVADGVWTLEARIPFSGFPLAGPSGPWTFHLARTRAKAGQHLTALRSPVTGFHDLACFDVLEGIELPERTVCLLDASPGEMLWGRNIARATLKNWGDKPAQVEVSAGIVGSPAARGKGTVIIEPGGTASVQAAWELDESAEGKPASVEARLDTRLIQDKATLVAKLPDILGNVKANAYYITQAGFVRLELPVNIAEATRPELQLRWTARDASGKTVGRGFAAVSGPTAVVRLECPAWGEGYYTLTFELTRGDRRIASTEQTIRLINSPWGEK